MNPNTEFEVAQSLKRGVYLDRAAGLLTNAVLHIADEIRREAKPLNRADIRLAMGTLCRHRHFDHVHEIGIAWWNAHGCDAIIQRLLAQATLELGGLDRADELIDQADKLVETNPADLEYAAQKIEYQAMRGRIRKQRYVLTNDVNVLMESITCYEKSLHERPNFYLGVNVLALRTQLHDQISQSVDELASLAHEVLRLAREAILIRPTDPWPLAASSEACLALHRFDVEGHWCDWAELWLYRFLNHLHSGPFEIEAYFRQLREVWNGTSLGQNTCADRLAGICERHVLHTQRRWSVDIRQLKRIEANTAELEKNFSGEQAFTIEDVRKMLALVPNIGCVTNAKGVRMGTGFLVSGAGFKREGLLFITNAHVISDTALGAIRAADARVTFEVEAGSELLPCHVKEILFTSEAGELGKVDDAPGKLDVTICVLNRTPSDANGLAIASAVPLPSNRSKAFVVGHPRTGELQFSLQDSILLDVCVNERLVHYRTPTDPGSSGSPVFNKKWEVVALHHAGSQTCPRLFGQGSYEANEGITLNSIRRGWCKSTRTV